MVLDGLLGDAQLVGDLAVGLAFGLADDHVALAWREPLEGERFTHGVGRSFSVLSTGADDDDLPVTTA